VSWLAPIDALRWARGNRVKVASAASAASATLTRLSTPVRSRGGASRWLSRRVGHPSWWLPRDRELCPLTRLLFVPTTVRRSPHHGVRPGAPGAAV
jgi:hypothetical protein